MRVRLPPPAPVPSADYAMTQKPQRLAEGTDKWPLVHIHFILSAKSATSADVSFARVAKLVKAPVCKTGHREFESRRVLSTAEMEQDRLVWLITRTSPGATPGSATKLLREWWNGRHTDLKHPGLRVQLPPSALVQVLGRWARGKPPLFQSGNHGFDSRTPYFDFGF